MSESLNAAVEGWLAAQRQGRTAETYRYTLRRWREWCAAHHVNPWQPLRMDVDAWRQSLAREGLSNTTIARHLSTLSSFYAYALDEAAVFGTPITHNPVERVKRPKVSKQSRADELSLEESRALRLAAIQAGPRTGALVWLLYGTAVRVSEAVQARVGDLVGTGDQRAIQVTRKGGLVDQVPIWPDVWQVIQLWLDTRNQPASQAWLFTSNGDDRMSRQTAYRLVHDLAVQTLGRASIGPHDLRHAVITLALDAGTPIQDVQRMAGHASPDTTQRYDRRARNRGKAASEAVRNLLEG